MIHLDRARSLLLILVVACTALVVLLTVIVLRDPGQTAAPGSGVSTSVPTMPTTSTPSSSNTEVPEPAETLTGLPTYLVAPGGSAVERRVGEEHNAAMYYGEVEVVGDTIRIRGGGTAEDLLGFVARPDSRAGLVLRVPRSLTTGPGAADFATRFVGILMGSPLAANPERLIILLEHPELVAQVRSAVGPAVGVGLVIPADLWRRARPSTVADIPTLDGVSVVLVPKEGFVGQANPVRSVRAFHRAGHAVLVGEFGDRAVVLPEFETATDPVAAELEGFVLAGVDGVLAANKRAISALDDALRAQ